MVRNGRITVRKGRAIRIMRYGDGTVMFRLAGLAKTAVDMIVFARILFNLRTDNNFIQIGGVAVAVSELDRVAASH
ncbi:hypothetical protein D3C71_2190330 [compost metagenome]